MKGLENLDHTNLIMTFNEFHGNCCIGSNGGHPDDSPVIGDDAGGAVIDVPAKAIQ